MKNNKYVLLDFYAPWCGPCKRLGPIYEEAAGVLKNTRLPCVLVKIDATVSKTAIKKIKLKGYPTVVLFIDGIAQKPLDKKNSVNDIVTYMTAMVEVKQPPKEDNKDSNVMMVNDGNIDEVLKNNKFVLLDFYAPQCSPCMKLAPLFKESADILKKLGAPCVLAKIDGTESKTAIKKIELDGYPTVVLFINGKPHEHLETTNSVDEIVTYMTTMLDKFSDPNEPKTKATSKTDDELLMLTPDTYQDFISKNEYVFVKFSKLNCPACDGLALEFKKLEKSIKTELKDVNIKLATVNCDEDFKFCENQGVKYFPTLSFIKKGEAVLYEGRRELSGMVDYLRLVTKDSIKEAKVEVKAEEEDGVKLLTLDEQFDLEVIKKEVTMVNFYDDECDEECFYRKKDFAGALAVVEKAAAHKCNMFKVNASKNKKLADRFSIKKFPSILFFKNGVQQTYNGGNLLMDILSFIKKQIMVVPVTTEDGVLVLEDTNIEPEIASHDFLVVAFYTSAQEGLAYLMQELKAVSDSGILYKLGKKVGLAKVNTMLNPDVMKKFKFQPQGFPYIYIFHKTEARHQIFDNENKVSKATLINWIKTSVSLPEEINGVQLVGDLDFKEIEESSQNTILFFYRKGDEDLIENFTNTVKYIKENDAELNLRFGLVNVDENDRLKEFFEIGDKPVISSYKKGTISKEKVKGDFSEDDMREWIEINLLEVIRPKKEIAHEMLSFTDENFGDMLHDKKYILSFFEKKDCNDCKEFDPIFEGIAQSLIKEHPPIYSGKFKQEDNRMIIKDLKITNFPVVLLFDFTAPNPYVYEGDANAEEISAWVMKKLGRDIIPIQNMKEYDQFNDSLKKYTKLISSIIYVGDLRFNEARDSFNTFKTFSKEIGFLKLGVCSTIDCVVNKGHDKIIIKTEDDVEHELKGGFSLQELIDFSNKFSFPLAMDYDDKAINVLFNEKRPGMIFFLDRNVSYYDRIKKLAKSISEESRGTIPVVVTTELDDGNSDLRAYLKVDEEVLPLLMIILFKGEQMLKFKYDGDFIQTEIMEWLNKWTSGTLELHNKSEPVPSERFDENGIMKLVGSEFVKVTTDEKKSTLVYFYSELCEHCKEMDYIYKGFALESKRIYPDLVVAKWDDDKNDNSQYTPQHYPSLVLFRPGHIRPVAYRGFPEIAEIIDFLDDYVTRLSLIHI